MKIKTYQPKHIFELGKRKNQEDFIWPLSGDASKNDRLFVVCDGMGGHEAGEVASEAVATAIGKWFEQHVKEDDIVTTDDMEQAVAYAYETLDQKDPDGTSDMGTTLTAIAFHRGGCIATHMGDSRIYHINKRERSIRYKSRDHSLVHDLWAMGEITYEEMSTHPRRNVITKAMQSGLERRCEATIVHIAHLEEDDYLYLCSDGMLEQMSDQEIVDILCGPGSDDEKVEMLTQATIDNSDNHSAYLIHIADVKQEDGDEALQDDEADMRDPVQLSDEPLNENEDVPDEEAEAETADEPKKRGRTWKWLLVLLLLVLAAVAGAIVKTLYFNK